MTWWLLPCDRRHQRPELRADERQSRLVSHGVLGECRLLELPVDGVKIDRRFVAGIDVDPAATNLTTAIIGLSDSLRLGCVAEGVEQPYQRDRLIELGCTALQGWLFSPAVAAEEALAMMPRIVLTEHVQTFQRVPR